ncbi:hypothetical protein [Pseudomonas sp.]|uniref:hypothetical protein n=1 Tax=Pseudomonas sp. TaxID=306 RepID=UPI0028AE421B|nr:hypothetical protein [Pseudomonas sp.]
MSFAASIYDLDTMNSVASKINHVQLTSFKKILSHFVALMPSSNSRDINHLKETGKPDSELEPNLNKNS